MPLVVIDPGHGGSDPGTVSNGYQEKNLVLQASLLLRDALRRCGITVLMTRETDTLPNTSGTIADDLHARAELANQNHADLFLSWHVDSASTADVNGVAVWIYPGSRGTRTETFAQRIVDSIAATTGQKNRGVYYGDFQVLRDTTMDAVLVESGFLTNVQEAYNLADPSFQQRMVEGAAQGICTDMNVAYVPPVTSNAGKGAPGTGAGATTGSGTTTGATTGATTGLLPSDAAQWPAWAADAIRQVISWGVMTGYPDGTWRPNETVTRAQLADVLVRFHDFLKTGR